jgi:hypothetical protein
LGTPVAALLASPLAMPLHAIRQACTTLLQTFSPFSSQKKKGGRLSPFFYSAANKLKKAEGKIFHQNYSFAYSPRFLHL